MKLNQDRAWYLRHWSRGGWSIPRPDCIGVKKWEAALARLIKDGLLEVDVDYGAVYRITDAGRQALSEKEG